MAKDIRRMSYEEITRLNEESRVWSAGRQNPPPEPLAQPEESQAELWDAFDDLGKPNPT
jgi:hypothetical protein